MASSNVKVKCMHITPEHTPTVRQRKLFNHIIIVRSMGYCRISEYYTWYVYYWGFWFCLLNDSVLHSIHPAYSFNLLVSFLSPFHRFCPWSSLVLLVLCYSCDPLCLLIPRSYLLFSFLSFVPPLSLVLYSPSTPFPHFPSYPLLALCFPLCLLSR